MRITILSPYNGGSHRAWAEGYQRWSGHKVTTMTLPARFWKWRMHGGAVTLARRFLASMDNPDLFLATDMVDLTTFLALTRSRASGVPAALYMHENQLTYPLPADGATGPMRRQLGERDRHYAFINYASMLAANKVFFNSVYHRNSFFAALPGFLNHFPEFNESASVEVLKQKSRQLAVGIDFDKFGEAVPPAIDEAGPNAPLILWNQRWEYDKNPTEMFQALFRVKEEGVPFRLALCGQQYGRRPDVFDEGLSRLAEEIVHAGHADEETYRRLLWEATITLSTAHHEFFGIGVMEAIHCHTFPILPRRLSYPELLPEQYHLQCLYDNLPGLEQRLQWALRHPRQAGQVAASLSESVGRYDWRSMAPHYDALFEDMRIAKN